MFDNLNGIEGIEPEQLYKDFEQLMIRSSFSKNHVLHEEGTVCNHLYLIEQGLARAYYFKEDKDITAHFAFEGTIITAIDSFIQRKRSKYAIELLEDSTIISFSYQDLQALLAEKPAYEKFFRMFLEQIYINLAERIEDLLFHDASERYNKLIEKNPELLQRVNLQHIASYVGVTPETLSRIRAKVAF